MERYDECFVALTDIIQGFLRAGLRLFTVKGMDEAMELRTLLPANILIK